MREERQLLLLGLGVRWTTRTPPAGRRVLPGGGVGVSTRGGVACWGKVVAEASRAASTQAHEPQQDGSAPPRHVGTYQGRGACRRHARALEPLRVDAQPLHVLLQVVEPVRYIRRYKTTRGTSAAYVPCQVQ